MLVLIRLNTLTPQATLEKLFKLVALVYVLKLDAKMLRSIKEPPILKRYRLFKNENKIEELV